MPSFKEQISGKRVALSLASGFFGFYHHAGVIAALEEIGIRPHRISGTSAGALTASMYAAGLDGLQMRDLLLEIRRKDFWDMHWPFTRYGFGLLSGRRFAAELARVLPVHSFEECRVPLSVGVFDLKEGRVRHLSSGPLVPAVCASCAFPYLLTPQDIDGRRYWDGGLGEKTPLVPFLKEPKVDVAIVSYMPTRKSRRKEKGGLKEFVPSLASMFVDTPLDERIERDKVSVKLLRDSGVRVLVLAPERVWLGPFSLERAKAAFEQGFSGTLSILESDDESLLGSTDLN